MSPAADEEHKFLGPNLNISLVCPDCKVYPPDLVERFSEGDVVCALCGLVLSDRIVDTRSEWRTFSNDDQNGGDPSRVGDATNPLLDGDQLSTMISYSPDTSRAGKELNKAQSRSIVDRRDHALQSAYARMSQMCEGYHLPKIVQEAAKEVFKIVHDERALKGKSQDSIIAAAIFIGCRKANVARTFKEIWALTNVPRKEIGKVFKIMNRVIQDHGLSNGAATTDAVSTTNAEDLIGRFCSHLGLSAQISNAAEYIAKRTKEIGVLAGRSPITIAATVIYMAAMIFKNPVQPSKIADRTGVSDGTIKTSYRYLYEKRDQLMDPYWIESGKVKLDDIPRN